MSRPVSFEGEVRPIGATVGAGFWSDANYSKIAPDAKFIVIPANDSAAKALQNATPPKNP